VIIIGTSKSPENGETKDLKGFFDKFLYMPYPDYASRVLIWKHYLAEKILEGMKLPEETKATGLMTQAQRAHLEDEMAVKVRLAMERVNISSLAHVSEGYSAGSIARTVRIVITPRRVAMVRLRPLSNYDFIDNLSFQDVNYQDDKATFMEFTRVITGLSDRRKKVESIISGEPIGGKGDKKGKKK
jgi:hypothetical protein